MKDGTQTFHVIALPWERPDGEFNVLRRVVDLVVVDHSGRDRGTLRAIRLLRNADMALPTVLDDEKADIDNNIADKMGRKIAEILRADDDHGGAPRQPTP